MSTCEELLRECESIARDARNVRAVKQWLEECPAETEFVCDACREYLYGRVYVAVGGPSIFIDTRTESVEGRWGADRVSVPCDTDILDKELRALWSNCF